MGKLKFLGIRLCEHDSNITYSNGTQVKYYKSERDLQIKHHGYNDLTSWKKIFDTWNLDTNEIDAIGIVIDCFRHRHIKCDESKLYENIEVPVFRQMGFKCPIFRINHHYAHSLSIWTLNIKSDIDFVFDGFGDDDVSHTIFLNSEKTVEFKNKTHKSFGIILSEFGRSIGISGHPNDIPGKLMAIKGYGEDSHMKKMFNLSNLDKLWDIKNIETRHKDDSQNIINHVRLCHEQSEMVFVDYFKEKTSKEDIISYSGGVAQNTVINSKLKKERPNLHIPPHCTDEGLSLGIVEFLRKYYEQDALDTTGYPFWQSDIAPLSFPSKSTIKKIAEKLARGEIIGWYQGHGEIGSRALGNRSILMNPTNKNGKEILNKKVKNREWYRPFGASILEEKTSRFFDWDGTSPYMLYVMDILDKKSFPSITHVDGTCRIQTVSTKNEIYYNLIEEFEKLTGIPILLNTSLNNGGKPICGSPNEALDLFYRSGINTLVVGNDVFDKQKFEYF